VKIWDAETGKQLWALKGNGRTILSASAEALAFSPDGSYLATANADNEGLQLVLWNTANGQPQWTHTIAVPNATERRHDRWLDMAYRPDGQELAVTSRADDTIRLVVPSTGRVVHTLNEHTGAVRAVAYNPDSRRLASAGADRTVRLWDATTGRLLHTLHGHGEEALCVAFNPDGQRLASGSGSVEPLDRVVGQVILWDTRRDQEALVLPAIDFNKNIAATPDGRFLAVAERPSAPSRVQVWDLEAGQMVQAVTGRQVLAVGGRPDGTLLGLLVQDGSVQVWNLTPPRPVCTLEGWVEEVRRLNVYEDRACFSPDGRLVALSDFQDELRVWDAVSSRRLWNVRFEAKGLHPIAFSPDGRRLAVQVPAQVAPGEQPDQYPADLRLYDAATGQVMLTLSKPGEFQRFSPDGRYLLLRQWDGRPEAEGKDFLAALAAQRFVGRVVDAADGTERATIRQPGRIAYQMACSPDGRHLALADWKRQQTTVWDLTTGRPVSTLRGYHSVLGALTFSPDGTRLVTGGDDGTVRLWDPITGEEVLTLRGHLGQVERLMFTRDGRRLISLGHDGTARVWDARPMGEGQDAATDATKDPIGKFHKGVKGLGDGQKKV
jgi:WD40 repeat protein